jgi:hypothetical protein
VLCASLFIKKFALEQDGEQRKKREPKSQNVMSEALFRNVRQKLLAQLKKCLLVLTLAR